ncbi:LysR family transcriptional regulator [Actinomadura sp. LD22]|uniref:LysR family transcriptional regulator n=1 Tax=Actinomadura physcomitrii TaxID=2650748 RepID=A0A6I4MPT6_9ACTN|nr:LysR family transcriptional regulator [Actinomadura physcomitrii]MWA07010.1 LysR family transcriptional regulator [Actinomadura physcomitrii]
MPLDVATVGGYGILARELSTERIGEIPDVQGLDRLVEVEGPELVRILDAVVATGSMRQAAERVCLHHNSVVRRVAMVECHLGFEITEPYGRNRMFMAVMLRRLRDSAAVVAGVGEEWLPVEPSG